jgi:WD40 repeat protein
MPVDFYKLEKAFQERLSTATVEHPLVLFVDALDQLSGGDPAREARWLPPELPPHVKVIVSTIDDGQLLPGGLQVRLQRMATSEGGEAMAALLHEARRTLQPWQREKVLAHFKRWGLPLYMKLAAEECRLWKSFSRPEACMLGEGISGVLDSLFERLASNANHGSAMVERSLGYLAAARYGLTEDEMLDILAKDDAVWNDFDNRKYHKVSERRLPLVVWSRLSLDLEPYLTERVAPGGTVIAFFHRRIAEWSVSHYPSGAEKHVRHGDLARYFLEMPAWLDDDRKTPNARRAVELPFQQREAEKWNEAQSTLLDCQFLFAKVAAELVLDLDADYRVLLAVRQDETLRLIHGALLLSMNVVLKEGRQYASQMVGRLMGLKGRDALTKFVAELTSTAPRPWLRPMRAGLKPPGGALIRSLGSHAQRVNSVSILNDGSVAASGGQDGVLQLHRLKDQEIQFLSGHTDEINTVLVSRIGEELVAISGAGKRLPFKLMIQLKGFVERTDSRASRDNTIRVWNVADGTLRHTLEGHTAAVRSLASRSRLLLSGSDDGTIRMWDLQEGKSLGILGSQGAPVVLLVMRPEALAVVAFSEYDFQLWDINERRGSGKSHFDYYWQNVLALEPEPMLVALQDTSASGYAYRLKIWDIGNSSDGREIFSTIDSFKHSFNYAQFVNGGKEILVGGTDHIIRLYNIASAEELGQYSRHNSEVTSLAVAEETGNIVSGAADGEILLWNLNCREQPDRPEGHSDDVNSVAVSPDGFTATSACQDGSAIVWSAPSASLIWTFFAGGRLPVRCTAISGDGRLAAFGSDDGTISVRETESGTELVRLVGHEKLVSCVAFCEGDTGIISGSMDKTVRVWKIKDPSKVQVFEGHEEGIRALACSNRGVIAVSGDDSGQLIVWDVVNGGQQRKLDAFYDPAELERSTRALWAVATGPEWPAIPGVQNAPCIESLALSPDDRWLIIGQRNRPIVVLDLVSDSERLKLVGHTGMVLGLSVTAGGRRLVSAADDRSMRVWDLSNGSCIAAFTADRPLYSCAADAAGDLLVAGEGANSGMVHFLSLVEEGDSSVS